MILPLIYLQFISAVDVSLSSSSQSKIFMHTHPIQSKFFENRSEKIGFQLSKTKILGFWSWAKNKKREKNKDSKERIHRMKWEWEKQTRNRNTGFQKMIKEIRKEQSILLPCFTKMQEVYRFEWRIKPARSSSRPVPFAFFNWIPPSKLVERGTCSGRRLP